MKIRTLFVLALSSLLGAFLVTGCQLPPAGASGPAAKSSAADLGPVQLREGDVIKVAFPSSPNLDTTQPIRRDGRITLPLIGEFQVVGKTPSDLEKALVAAYDKQIVSKEIQVTVVQSTYPVFVTGAVLRPGKIMADHPITALEAIMEAGGFDYNKGDLKKVTIIRTEGTDTKHFYIDLKAVLQGQSAEPFYLKPSDIVYVPDRFSWL